MSELVVAIEGEVDVATVPGISGRLREAVESNPGATVTADLAKVTFLDSTGLGALISTLRRARAAGGELVVANAQPNVAKVFQITGLDKVIALVST